MNFLLLSIILFSLSMILWVHAYREKNELYSNISFLASIAFDIAGVLSLCQYLSV